MPERGHWMAMPGMKHHLAVKQVAGATPNGWLVFAEGPSLKLFEVFDEPLVSVDQQFVWRIWREIP